jgi:hypothetical protein
MADDTWPLHPTSCKIYVYSAYVRVGFNYEDLCRMNKETSNYNDEYRMRYKQRTHTRHNGTVDIDNPLQAMCYKTYFSPETLLLPASISASPGSNMELNET